MHKVRLIQCGPFANESEQRAAQTLKAKLESLQGDGLWILFLNIEFSSQPNSRPEEIDIFAIGPSGVHVIEVKHWDNKYVENKLNGYTVDDQAEILLRKARRVAGRIKKYWSGVNFIQGRFLLTKGEASYLTLPQVKGASFYSLRDWQELMDVKNSPLLSVKQVDDLAAQIVPSAKVSINGDVRHFGQYSNLELRSDRNDRFHRIYRGLNARTQDKVILHVYDYSASEATNADLIARREYETIQRLQKAPWSPRLMESFQEAPEYPGELYFFSLIDPAAPTIEDRSGDTNWKTDERAKFAVQCFHALSELHEPSDPDNPSILHRNLNPSTIHVRANGKPLFSGLRLTRIADLGTLPVEVPTTATPIFAPEVRQGGLGSASPASDVYSLAFSLNVIFQEQSTLSEKVKNLLGKGLSENPSDRPSAATLATMLSDLIAKLEITSTSLPAAKYWDEGTEIDFGQSRYRVISKLGSGGWGTTFKVVEVDKNTGEEYCTYVAKAIHSEPEGNSAIKAHKKIRAHTTHPALSFIHEIAEKWKPDAFVSLLRWIDGVPLSSLSGQLTSHAAEYGESTVEEMLIKWLISISDGLSMLHEAGYAHCDVSPKNLIVAGPDIFLTDYDLATRIGMRAISKGTLQYCSPAMQAGMVATANDDLFSLAASFFEVLAEQAPFNDLSSKANGLLWTGVDITAFPRLVAFLDTCTSADETKRFKSAAEASQFLRSQGNGAGNGTPEPPVPAPKTQNEIAWLTEVLRSYPKSRFGNAETRGLDSDFAKLTYVETELERKLIEGIVDRTVKLVILTGNAGDGKTAFLQHLANTLGLTVEKSSTRVIDQTLSTGLRVKINLDGSASFQGKTATALLDELFEPFHKEPAPPSSVHLVAINSGPLMAWVEDFESRHQNLDSKLTDALWRSIEGDFDNLPNWLRFIDFNDRSLVGGVNESTSAISTHFVDELVDAMLGGSSADELWSACQTCTAAAHCPITDTVSLVRGKGRYTADDAKRMRNRLYAALQAVHQRAEVHITARDLRGALSYILFGLHNCHDVHTGTLEEYIPYWDRAFSAKSPRRQGEVLMELCTLDPALESNPNMDRFLLGLYRIDDDSLAQYPEMQLPSARRRAYFEWQEQQIAKFGENADAFGIRKASHFDLFRGFPLLRESEKEQICRDVCVGLSRLVDLPDVVLNQPNQVPLRVTPRTPTETVFWVNKPISRFSLESALRGHVEEMEALHTHLILKYQYLTGSYEDLYLSADLFSILMELKDGYQFVDAALDDTFANLSIFIGRLAQENQTELLAWNPANENKTYRVSAVMQDGTRTLQLT
jgi:serine/threonine protein kinase